MRWDYRDCNNTEVTSSWSTSAPESAPLLFLWVSGDISLGYMEKFAPSEATNGPPSHLPLICLQPALLLLSISPSSPSAMLPPEPSPKCSSYHMVLLLNTHLWGVLIAAVRQPFPTPFSLAGRADLLGRMQKCQISILPDSLATRAQGYDPLLINWPFRGFLRNTFLLNRKGTSERSSLLSCFGILCVEAVMLGPRCDHGWKLTQSHTLMSS